MSNNQSTREWKEKVAVVQKLHDIMERLIQKKDWTELSKLYNGISIDTGMGSVSFSDSAEVNAWLTSHYDPVMNEINVNAYANLFKQLRLGGKRTRRRQTHRQRTRRQKK